MDKPNPSPTASSAKQFEQAKESKFDFKSFRTFFKGTPSAPEVPLDEQLKALKESQKTDLIKHMTKHGLIPAGEDQS